MPKSGTAAARIVVIDDDESMRQLLALHLRNARYEVFLAQDAIVGARFVVECKPDLIVCDIEMPYMDGYEFAAALRADPSLRSIPLIFLTATDDAGDRSREFAAHYVAKPVMADRLLALVAECAAGNGAAAANEDH